MVHSGATGLVDNWRNKIQLSHGTTPLQFLAFSPQTLSEHGIFRTFVSPNSPYNRTITNHFPSISLILLRLHDSMTFTNDHDY